MCTVLLPPVVYPIAVKYIIYIIALVTKLPYVNGSLHVKYPILTKIEFSPQILVNLAT